MSPETSSPIRGIGVPGMALYTSKYIVAPELLCHLGHVVLGCPRANPLFVPVVWYKMQSALIFLSRIFEVWWPAIPLWGVYLHSASSDPKITNSKTLMFLFFRVSWVVMHPGEEKHPRTFPGCILFWNFLRYWFRWKFGQRSRCRGMIFLTWKTFGNVVGF